MPSELPCHRRRSAGAEEGIQHHASGRAACQQTGFRQLWRESGDILVQKAPACTIAVLAQAVRELFCPEAETRVIGIRHGEKLYETLLTNEECAHALDLGGFYRVPCDKRDLNYDKYFTQGDQTRNTLTEFNSNNTALLNVEQVKEKLLALPYIQQELAEWEKQA